MNVFLIDGTYELFRHFYAVPSTRDVEGREVGAVRGVVGSVLRMLEDDVTHLGVATDHVIESFRNALWPGYKTSDGIDPALFSQFHPLEEALEALGVVVWPMTDLEADDGLASAAAKASGDPRVEQVFICTPDKDLSQCVTGRRVVQFDRRAGSVRDADGVRAKFGVPPASIPDYLALVGDTADGFRGYGDGVRSRRRSCSAAISISRRFPTPRRRGTSRCGVPAVWLPSSQRTATWPPGFATSQPYAPPPRSSRRLTTCGGPARAPFSSRFARGLTPRASSNGRRPWRGCSRRQESAVRRSRRASPLTGSGTSQVRADRGRTPRA